MPSQPDFPWYSVVRGDSLEQDDLEAAFEEMVAEARRSHPKGD